MSIPHMRPLTLHGLTSFLDVTTVYFNRFEERLKGKEDDESKGFVQVITRIRETIYRQKFEGAAAGFLNPNIIARDLGLTDKKDLTSKGEKIPANVNVSILDSNNRLNGSKGE